MTPSNQIKRHEKTIVKLETKTHEIVKDFPRKENRIKHGSHTDFFRFWGVSIQ